MQIDAAQDFKTENGKRFRRSDYAYTPSNNPSEWKLRLTNTPGGKPDPRIVGAAVAALGKVFRGQKVQIPATDLPAVKRRVLRAWRQANPDHKPEDVPEILRQHEADAMSVVDGVAPPGWEKTIKKMKKSGDVSNPWALAWFMHHKKMRPGKRDEDEDAVGYSNELAAMARVTPPAICLAAARGESWAQAVLLACNGMPFQMEASWR